MRNAIKAIAAEPKAPSSKYAASPAVPTPAATNGAAQYATQAVPVIQPIAFPVLDIDDLLTLFQGSEAKPWSGLHSQGVAEQTHAASRDT
jgi:hypothetical protein